MKHLPLSIVVTLLSLSACSGGDDSGSTNDQLTMQGQVANSDQPNTGSMANTSIEGVLISEIGTNNIVLTGWACFTQDEIQVAIFAFYVNGTGKAQTLPDMKESDFEWSVSADDSIVMGFESPGDSQLQSVTILDSENFVTTDSSFNGIAPGPLTCEKQRISMNDGVLQYNDM